MCRRCEKRHKKSRNLLYCENQGNIVPKFNYDRLMTIEVLKNETARLSKLEKLEFLQFLAELLTVEERASVLTAEQERTLLRRRDEIKSGKVETIPAHEVKAKLVKKYGLHA